MNHPRTLLILPLVLTLLPAFAVAQAAEALRVVTTVGLAGALSGLPSAVQAGCADALHATGELRVGVSRGRMAMEGRGAWLRSLNSALCLNTGWGVRRLDDGRLVHVVHPFRPSDSHTLMDVRLRAQPRTEIPLVVSAGVGWLAPQSLPMVVGSVGLRTRGPARLTVDLDLSSYRIPFDIVGDATPVENARVRSAEGGGEWRRSVAVRVGTEIALR